MDTTARQRPRTRPMPDAPAPAAVPRRARAVLVGIGAAALLLAGFGIATRVRARNELKSETRRTAAPTVATILPEKGAASRDLVLPGTAQAFQDAPIYARTNGYLKEWLVDIGSRVRQGQLLARIDSPEVEQQLQQARADLATAQANERLAKITADRYADLVRVDYISKQDADNANEALAARRAATESARANVRRLENLAGFQRIEAPFDGVITARNANVGQLVDAGTGGGPGRELFHIATVERLRVFVGVPQTEAAAAAPGGAVDVTLAERPGRRFPGRIVRNSGAIDPATRTILVEIDLDNRDREILPGASVQVHWKAGSDTSTLLLPVSALMFRAEGVRVATLQDGRRARLFPVTLGRDFGTKVEVTSGLPAGVRVIDSPPDSLVDGQEVREAGRN